MLKDNFYNYIKQMEKNYTFYIKPDNEIIKNHYDNHKTFHNGDAGIDLYNGMITKISEYQYKIDFGFQCEMVDETNKKNISYLLVPRSSIVKTKYRMSNSIGIIDAGYRGNLIAYVDIIHDEISICEKIRKLFSNELYENNSPKEGERLFQIVLGTLEPINKIKLTNELSKTSRGDGGFGSTNISQTIIEKHKTEIIDINTKLCDKINIKSTYDEYIQIDKNKYIMNNDCDNETITIEKC